MLGLISGSASHAGNEAAAVGAEDVDGNERCKPLRSPSNAGKHDGRASTLRRVDVAERGPGSRLQDDVGVT
jgi:hypothetical protein